MAGDAHGLAGAMADATSGGIGVPNVAAALGADVGEGLAGGAEGSEEGYGVAGITAAVAPGGLPIGLGGPDGDANGETAPPRPKPGAPAGGAEFPPNGSGPFAGADMAAGTPGIPDGGASASAPPGGDDVLALGNSTFGPASHASATPGGWPVSALLRASETYTP